MAKKTKAPSREELEEMGIKELSPEERQQRRQGKLEKQANSNKRRETRSQKQPKVKERQGVYISNEHRELLKEMGKGNISAGVAEGIKAWIILERLVKEESTSG